VILHASLEIPHFVLDRVSRLTVLLLQGADELIALSCDPVDVVIGELSPLLPHLALELAPIAL
jgi:hypothetical protein